MNEREVFEAARDAAYRTEPGTFDAWDAWQARAALQSAPGQEPETASVAWLHRPDELRRMKAVFERDRTIVADAIKAITKALAAREWLRLGRGSYEWNDDRWKDEFGAAFDEILQALEPLKTLAADLSDCPILPADIAHARTTPPTSATVEAATIERLRELLEAVRVFRNESMLGALTKLRGTQSYHDMTVAWKNADDFVRALASQPAQPKCKQRCMGADGCDCQNVADAQPQVECPHGVDDGACKECYQAETPRWCDYVEQERARVLATTPQAEAQAGETAETYKPLTDDECDEFRRRPGSFNDMMRAVHEDGWTRYCCVANEFFGNHYKRKFERAQLAAQPQAEGGTLTPYGEALEQIKELRFKVSVYRDDNDRLQRVIRDLEERKASLWKRASEAEARLAEMRANAEHYADWRTVIIGGQECTANDVIEMAQKYLAQPQDDR